MKFSNSHKAPLYNSIIIVPMLILLMGSGAFLLGVNTYGLLGTSLFMGMIIVPVVLLLIVSLRGRQIFEYDSEGETLNLSNKGSLFRGKFINDEFPKYKLQHYEIVDLLVLRRLYITISSKRNRPIILKYEISYLTPTQLRELCSCLDEVIKNNQENRQEP
ncbi:hypothetical protein [Chryseobacterium sp. 6424]|uniref:hypothetical protein n=1 Tax=Chryseobacterium sp. 6424 TaxID=2039166 RepID=UPI0013CEDC7B|nr:hypothetical protein [Chryseobacterium sp. 6424]